MRVSEKFRVGDEVCFWETDMGSNLIRQSGRVVRVGRGQSISVTSDLSGRLEIFDDENEFYHVTHAAHIRIIKALRVRRIKIMLMALRPKY